ncbi:MAG: CBS domain-containing protein [Burkholderiales bacterium]|nr:CBS domain-containing protein [Burkholderiales bacterium]
MATASPPPLIERALVDFFARHAPFDRMERAHLVMLAGSTRARYYRDGASVIGPADGPCMRFFMVQRGEVQGQRAGTGSDQVALGPGECFPLGALIGARATSSDYRARGDTFCLEFEKQVFDRLLAESEPFRLFCTRRLAHLLEISQSQSRAAALEEAQARQGLTSLLGDLAKRSPVACTPHTPLAEALATMERERIGAILVTDASHAARGIFTERDLLRRVVLDRTPLDVPIERVMTAEPLTLPETATAFDAAMSMALRGIRHIPVTRGEGALAPVIGMVSERDLFALQRVGMRDVARAIRGAGSRAALINAAKAVRMLAGNMQAQGVGNEQLTQLIVALNDSLVARAIELVEGEFDLAGVDWCWIALGSEGRREQTVATDQDNAIIFRTDADAGNRAATADALRQRLLPLARAVNEFLAELGFPLCKGEIMAGNPQWCLSDAEWRARFGDWLRNPTPQALLSGAIFFDLRALAGRTELADILTSWLAEEAPRRQPFLRALAANALAATPPGGLFGALTEHSGIDLKSQGARPIIDAARVLALALGLPATATSQRLRLWATRTGDAPLADAAIQAFQFIQGLRMSRQLRGVADPLAANHIDLGELNELDRRILKEAFRQARKLQDRLRVDFAL